MSNGNFRRALLELDRELANVPFTGERDVRTLVRSRRRIPWRLPALALTAAIALLVFIRVRDREPVHVAGFTIDAPPSSWETHGDDVEVMAQKLDLDVPGFGRVVAQHGARVARVDGGIRVERGHVDVDVTHRPTGAAPALVRVSHGTIAVLGTRFTIEQSEHGGHVVLHEGRIRFESGGRSVILTPGSSLTWPLAPIASTATPSSPGEPAPPARVDAEPSMEPVRKETALPSSTPSPSTLPPSTLPPSTLPPSTLPPSTSPPSTPSAPQSPAVNIDRVLADLANLRARRRFVDAAALLEQALTAELPIATAERLSYELGDIRTYQLADTARACRHWQSHRARFPQGRYSAEVAAAVRRLGCEETTP